MRLVMEEEPRKRKITNINDEEEEEDEDVKMEKFFALIRSAKDIRDQLLDTTEGSRPIATTTAAATVAAAAVKSDKKAVAKADKRAEVVKVHRKEKSLVDSQNTASKPGFTVAKFNQPSAPAVASSSGGGSGGGGVGGGKASIEEEKGGKKSADYKINNSNQKGGRVILDLNLSL